MGSRNRAGQWTEWGRGAEVMGARGGGDKEGMRHTTPDVAGEGTGGGVDIAAEGAGDETWSNAR